MEMLHQILQDPLYRYYFSALMVAFPLMRIFNRAGLPQAWTLLVIIPYIGPILCAGVLARLRWPVLPAKAGAK